jgi:hypothetical protein
MLPIPPEVLTQAQANIDATIALLAPYVLPLTPEERRDMPKTGNKSLSFVEKAYDYAKHFPELCPSYLNIADFGVDMADATGLRVLLISAQQLADNIDDTALVAGSESFQAALTFYAAVKTAVDRDVPGAKEAYNQLKERFPGTKRKSKE